MSILVLMPHVMIVLLKYCVRPTLVDSHPGMNNIKIELQCRMLSRLERQENTTDKNLMNRRLLQPIKREISSLLLQV
jgi:hypothetical protein